MILRILLSVLLLAAGAASAAAPHAAYRGGPAAGRAHAPGGTLDPVAYVRAIYAPTHTGVGGREGAGPYSSSPDLTPRLRALFLDDENYAHGEVGRLEFNPYTAAQDERISQVRVTARAVEGASDRRVVTARFRNMDSDQIVVYFFQRIGSRWFIDDIAYAGAQGSWTLSLILRYGYLGQ